MASIVFGLIAFAQLVRLAIRPEVLVGVRNAIGYARFLAGVTMPDPDALSLSAMISCTRLRDSPTKRLSRFRSDMPTLQ